KGILEVTRRYAKKFSGEFGGSGERSDGVGAPPKTATPVQGPVGYENIMDVCVDLEKLVDVIWVSGTPSLQVQYLLSIALLLTSYLTSFPASPRPTFWLLRKLDIAFASLLRGENVDTGETLGGFAATSRKMSITEMVRLKSLVERTRVVVVEVMGRGERLEESEDDGEGNEDGDMEEDQEVVGRWEMEIARVYELTIVELGESLGNSGADGP
ncbi:hypothetical protein GP486_007600, partial [Trichoglossum hirsutum]